MKRRRLGRILSRKDWPEELRVPYIKGVYLQGCVERGKGSSFRASAHAHTGGQFEGWICIRNAEHVASDRDERSRHLLLHERAHIATGEGHTDAFRRELLRIAGYLDRDECKYTVQTTTVVETKTDDNGHPYTVFAWGGGEHHPKCPCLVVFRARAYAQLAG